MLPIIIHIFRMLKKYLEFRNDDPRGYSGGRPTLQEPQTGPGHGSENVDAVPKFQVGQTKTRKHHQITKEEASEQQGL